MPMKKVGESPYFRSTLMMNDGAPSAPLFPRGRRTRTSPSDSCRTSPAVDDVEGFAPACSWL